MSDLEFVFMSWCVLWLAIGLSMSWRVWCRWRAWPRATGVVVSQGAAQVPEVLLVSGPRGQERVPVELIFGDRQQVWPTGRRVELAVDPWHQRAGVPRSGRDMAMISSVWIVPILLGLGILNAGQLMESRSRVVWDNPPPVPAPQGERPPQAAQPGEDGAGAGAVTESSEPAGVNHQGFPGRNDRDRSGRPER